jgi:hypothetical protein
MILALTTAFEARPDNPWLDMPCAYTCSAFRLQVLPLTYNMPIEYISAVLLTCNMLVVRCARTQLGPQVIAHDLELALELIPSGGTTTGRVRQYTKHIIHSGLGISGIHSYRCYDTTSVCGYNVFLGVS